MHPGSVASVLQRIYTLLLAHFGPQGWWPGETPFEICVGAILTQNTAWKNVEYAIKNLKQAGLLDEEFFFCANRQTIADCIRPAGYYHVKTKRLQCFASFVREQYAGRVVNMHTQEVSVLRKALLAVHGIGPETADSILLYALEKPVFVVDTYTRRVLSRHGLISEAAPYAHIQTLLMQHCIPDIMFFKEYHALIVAIGKAYCRPRAHCSHCPLRCIL